VRDLLTLLAGALGTLAVVLALLAGAGFLLLGWRLSREASPGAVGHTARDLALACAIALIVVLTLLMPTPTGSGLEPEPRLTPFLDLVSALRGDRSLTRVVAEMAANVALFIPFGLALRWRLPGLGLFEIGLASLALSSTMEVLQAFAVAGRWADSTDVIMNTIGGLVGAWLATLGAGGEPD